MAAFQNDAEREMHMARVFLAQARADRFRSGQFLFLNWAAKRRMAYIAAKAAERAAAAAETAKPNQLDLFA
jgi:hypothetical protein